MMISHVYYDRASRIPFSWEHLKRLWDHVIKQCFSPIFNKDTVLTAVTARFGVKYYFVNFIENIQVQTCEPNLSCESCA